MGESSVLSASQKADNDTGFCADGTFSPEAGVVRPRRGVGAAAAVAAVAIAMVALVYANTSSEWPQSVLMPEGQRTTKLAWGGFTGVMQDEADRALHLCKVGLLGKDKHCATHVVSTEDSKWTHTDAGQPTWAESQRVLSRQVPPLNFLSFIFLLVYLRARALAAPHYICQYFAVEDLFYVLAHFRMYWAHFVLLPRIS
jgi:hypothetical protein